MADSWESSILLNRYYEKVGRAAAGIGACPRLTTFKAGLGYIDENVPEGESPTVLPIPYDLGEVPGVFYEGAIEASYADGSTVCKCTIPAGGVSDPKKCSVFGLYDQDDELVAVCVSLPDWVSPSDQYTAYPSINFPIQTEEV
jgi:hypothetical protein